MLVPGKRLRVKSLDGDSSELEYLNTDSIVMTYGRVFLSTVGVSDILRTGEKVLDIEDIEIDVPSYEMDLLLRPKSNKSIEYLNFTDLNILYKYISNRVNFDTFRDCITDTYIMPIEHDQKWAEFQQNPIRFLTSNGNFGENILNQFKSQIQEKNYRG